MTFGSIYVYLLSHLCKQFKIAEAYQGSRITQLYNVQSCEKYTTSSDHVVTPKYSFLFSSKSCMWKLKNKGDNRTPYLTQESTLKNGLFNT